MDLYIFKNGKQFGPMTPEQAQQGLRSAQLQLNDKAITRGIEDWTTLEEVLRILESPTESANQTNLNVRPPLPFSTSESSVSTPSAQEPAQTIKPWGCFYTIGLFMAGAVLAVLAQQFPALEGLNPLFNGLGIVSLLALLIGLISPAIFGKITTKIPVLNTRFSQSGFTRKHVAYVFGTAFVLLMNLNIGTDKKHVEENNRLVAAQEQQRKAADTKRIEDEKRVAAAQEQQRKAAIAQAQEKVRRETQQRLAQEQEEKVRQQKLQAEARSAEVQARIDEKEEKAAEEKAAAKEATAKASEPVITVTPTGISIENRSKEEIDGSCYMNFNPIWGGGYQARIYGIKSGAAYEIPYSEFRAEKSDFIRETDEERKMRRFSPLTDTVKKIEINTHVDGKLVKYTERF